jgi:hypothetical protein
MLASGNRTGAAALRLAIVFGIAAGGAAPQEAPLVPRTVCDVVANLASLGGGSVAALGRYSFRATGRWLDEQACDPAPAVPPRLWLEEDAAGGPKPNGVLELDAAAVRRELAEVQKRTTLGKFRFGTPDYDRWAVVYGRVEARRDEQTGALVPTLVYRGSGALIFLMPDH